MLSISAVPVAYAQSQSDLESVLKEKKAAAEREAKLKAQRVKVQKEIRTLNSKLSNQVKTISALKSDILTVEEKIERIERDYAGQVHGLRAENRELSRVLGAMMRARPNALPPAIVAPNKALETTQTKLMVTSVSGSLNQNAYNIKSYMAELARIRGQLTQRQETLAQKNDRVIREERRLKTLVQKRSDTAAKIAKEEKQARKEVASLAAKANSLKQLIETLEKANKESKDNPQRTSTPGRAKLSTFKQTGGVKLFSKAKSSMIKPVEGRVAKSYSSAHRGISFKGKAFSPVEAPYWGRVEFAGPFKDYGSVVILNMGENYFLLLTGMGSIAVNSGDIIEKGDVIGALSASKTGTSDLYVELRKSGSTLNPKGWFKEL